MTNSTKIITWILAILCITLVGCSVGLGYNRMLLTNQIATLSQEKVELERKKEIWFESYIWCSQQLPNDTTYDL